jgi:hypothetical protein
VLGDVVGGGGGVGVPADLGVAVFVEHDLGGGAARWLAGGGDVEAGEVVAVGAGGDAGGGQIGGDGAYPVGGVRWRGGGAGSHESIVGSLFIHVHRRLWT